MTQTMVNDLKQSFNHSLIYQRGFEEGYNKCKEDVLNKLKRKYHLVDIDQMTSDVAKEYGEE